MKEVADARATLDRWAEETGVRPPAWVRNNRLAIANEVYRRLSADDLVLLGKQRAAMKALLRDGYEPRPPSPREPVVPPPTAAAATKPEPAVYAAGRQVTEDDVIETLRLMGDEVVTLYREGRMTRAEAYDCARHRLRQAAQVGAGRARWSQS